MPTSRRVTVPIGKALLFPFAVTRLLLLAVGWLSPLLLPTNSSQVYLFAGNTWWFSQIRLLDMWARWDSGWYVNIIQQGYSRGADFTSVSNVAFFPVYPYLVKLLLFLIPGGQNSNTFVVLLAVLLSNLFLLASLWLLYQLTLTIYKKTSIAQPAVWLVLVFPSSFFLSSVYTESTFLFFSLLSIWAAYKGKWWLAAVAGSVLGATRLVGLAIAVPLLIIYGQEKKWDIDKIDSSAAWLLLLPVGVLIFFSHLADVAGDFFAAVKSQAAWGRSLTDPLTTFLFPTGYWPVITQLDQFFMTAAIVSSLLLIYSRLSKLWPLGLYSLLITIPTLFTGTLDSSTRFVIVAFPLFMYWASVLDKKKQLSQLLKIGLMLLQLGLFALFTQFYWVG